MNVEEIKTNSKWKYQDHCLSKPTAGLDVFLASQLVEKKTQNAQRKIQLLIPICHSFSITSIWRRRKKRPKNCPNLTFYSTDKYKHCKISHLESWNFFEEFQFDDGIRVLRELDDENSTHSDFVL